MTRTTIKRVCFIAAAGLLLYMLAMAVLTSDADVLKYGLLGTFFG